MQIEDYTKKFAEDLEKAGFTEKDILENVFEQIKKHPSESTAIEIIIILIFLAGHSKKEVTENV